MKLTYSNQFTWEHTFAVFAGQKIVYQCARKAKILKKTDEYGNESRFRNCQSNATTQSKYRIGLEQHSRFLGKQDCEWLVNSGSPMNAVHARSHVRRGSTFPWHFACLNINRLPQLCSVASCQDVLPGNTSFGKWWFHTVPVVSTTLIILLAKCCALPSLPTRPAYPHLLR